MKNSRGNWLSVQGQLDGWMEVGSGGQEAPAHPGQGALGTCR